MLEKIPKSVGSAISELRSGMDAVAARDVLRFLPNKMILRSPDFEDGAPLPRSCTADGDGEMPTLQWNDVPPRTASLALLVEDADSPSPDPLVHCIIHGLTPTARSFA